MQKIQFILGRPQFIMGEPHHSLFWLDHSLFWLDHTVYHGQTTSHNLSKKKISVQAQSNPKLSYFELAAEP